MPPTAAPIAMLRVVWESPSSLSSCAEPEALELKLADVMSVEPPAVDTGTIDVEVVPVDNEIIVCAVPIGSVKIFCFAAQLALLS
jgi:hypothetical protein